MPTYDYQCTECDHKMEVFHAMSAAPLVDCPACGKPGLRKLIGAGAGLLFKGSGFYQTDYRSDSYQKAAKAETSGTSGSSGEGKSEGKAPKEAAAGSSPAGGAKPEPKSKPVAASS